MVSSFVLDASGLTPPLLGLARSHIDRLLEAPTRVEALNSSAEEALSFQNGHIRVVMSNGRAVEVAFAPPIKVLFGGQPLFEDRTVWRSMVSADGDAREALGFIVLRNLGVTLTGFHDGDDGQLAMTVFEAGRWDVLENTMRPFRL